MGFLGKFMGGHTASVKIVDSTLVISLPGAVTPVVWRMDIKQVKASVIEVVSGENGHYTLMIKTKQGETHNVATFIENDEAVAALMEVSAALDNIGTVTSAPPRRPMQSVAIPQGSERPAVSWLGGLASILFLAVLATFLFNANSRQVPFSNSMTVPIGDRGKNNQAVIPFSPANDHFYGNQAALISIIEYSDFECQYCLRFHPTARQLVDESSGTINWIFRHAPLHGVNSITEAMATECAAEQGGNEAFWRYGDTIFARTKSGGEGFPLENLVPLARELGLDEGDFSECLNEERYEDKLEQHLQEVRKLEIEGTPGIILVNNKTKKSKVFSGLYKLEYLKAEINGMRQ